MAIKGTPFGQDVDGIYCAICKIQVLPEDAMTCWCSLEGKQMFICNEHVKNASELILGWYNFVVSQEAQCVSQKQMFAS